MEWEPEEREWEQVKMTPNLTQDEKYVVCLDTMGQDRELTDEQKEFALTTVSYVAQYSLRGAYPRERALLGSSEDSCIFLETLSLRLTSFLCRRGAITRS